ncbi:alpha/beta hydrolase family protein [Robertkochia solimangrovi]|uniref:alpha/beta hydrolase family protein n=1 Tax=Robertkochia solimangrovi TaxID=2213046 RepID=UPI00118018A4|nr:alpha/beta fold hydrolase [Robertkochia solimangrovi]TRZ41295.1 alpha/beta hydrolase [Robertkochia solimangrovi]
MKRNIMQHLLQLIIFLMINISGAQVVRQGQFLSQRIVLEGKMDLSANDTLQLSLPDYGYNNVSMPVIIKEDSIIATNAQFGFSLKAKMENDSQWNCNFSLPNTKEYEVALHIVDSVLPLTFPQHPTPPFPYEVTRINFTGKKTGISYGGTLTTPKDKEHYPVAILISGTGKQDRDYVYAGHQFFTVLADALARKGIASLRVDDRGIGETGGDFEKATTADFADDAEEALEYLIDNKSASPEMTGLIGHSEGGIISTIVASRNPHVNFMISLSGVGVSGMKILELQNKAILNAQGIDSLVVSDYMELFNELFSTVYKNSDPDSLETEIKNSLQGWMALKDEETLKQLQLVDGRDENFLYRYNRQANSPWYRYMIRYEPEPYMAKINIPVLAVNGDRDIMVPAKENLEGFSSGIKGNNLTTVTYQGLNHFYQHCVSCTNREMGELQEVFAPEVLAAISKWINQQFKEQ